MWKNAKKPSWRRRSNLLRLPEKTRSAASAETQAAKLPGARGQVPQHCVKLELPIPEVFC